MRIHDYILPAVQNMLVGVNALALVFCSGSTYAATTSTLPIARTEAFFGVHFDLHPSAGDTILGRDASAKNIGRFLSRVKPDFVQYDCKGHAGYTGYPTYIGYPSPGIVKDALRLWRSETRSRGIGLYVHYSGVWDTAAIKHHPEWARVDENGNPDPNITSVFGDYASEIMIPQLKEVVSEYDLDGLWVDGECWAAKLDYGTTAVAEWKAISGDENVPKKPDEPRWQEWKQFHRQAFEDYLVNWVDEMHRHDPDLQITSNWAYTPHMPLPVRAKLDYLSGDFSAKESVDRARFEARYLDSTGMPWDLMAWGFNNHHGSPGEAHQVKMPEQLMQEASVVMGLGGGMQVYFQPTRGGFISPVITETVGAVADFCRERQEASHKSESIPQVALLLSSKSFLHRSDNVFSPHGQYKALEGALHALLENGYSVDLLAEHQLESRMNEFPVIAIAQAPVLDDDFRDEIIEYVQRGGTVVLLDYESTEPFSEYLQIEERKASVPTNAYVGDENGTAPVPGWWAPVDPAGAMVLEYRTDGQGIFTTAKDGSTTGLGSWTNLRPAVTSTEVLTGKMIAVHGPVSQAFFDGHHPVLRNWIGRVMQQAFKDPEARLIDAPHVDMSLRRSADGKPTVHLVNLSGAQRAERFAAIDTIPGSGPLKLEWNLDARPKQFYQLPGDKKLKFDVKSIHQGKHRTVIEVEDVPFHAIVVVDFDKE